MAGLRKVDTLAQQHARLLALLLRQHKAVAAAIEGSTSLGKGAWRFQPMVFGELIAAHEAVRAERRERRLHEPPTSRPEPRCKVLRDRDDDDQDHHQDTEEGR